MRLYETVDGRIVGTQAEAGKGFVKLDVPTDKAGLIDFLNSLRASPASDAPPAATQPPSGVLAAPDGLPTGSRPGLYGFATSPVREGTSTENRDRRARALAKPQAGEDADHFCVQVLEAPPFVIARVFEALSERVR